MPVLTRSLTRTSEPATDAVSLDVAKSHLRVSGSDDDTEIQAMLDAAIRRVEDETRRALITQTWTAKYDRWPDFPLDLFRPPVQSITVTYLDENDSSQTYDSGNYTLDTARLPGVLHLVSTASLPLLSDEANNVTLAVVCGYGATADDVDPRAVHAIKLMVEHLYDGCDLSPAYDTLISQLQWSYP